MTADSDLEAYLAPLALLRDKRERLTRGLVEAYTQLALNSEDQFLATPVTKLPTGTEKGEFLAIDLGGSNLRVAFINLLGLTTATGRRFSLPEYDERIEKYCQRSWPIGQNLKHERAEDLFSWLGDCLAEVIRARYEATEEWPKEIPLGITFSFPMMQETLSEATLMPMGKGFKITSNPDLGSMVLAGYERHTLSSNSAGGPSPLPRIKLVAISNDSVATLISLSYTTSAKPNSKAAVGLILGTGTNAAVPMPPATLAEHKVAYATKGAPADQIVVNTEWTLRGVGPALRAENVITRWDEALDAALETPGFQPFEYMTAGTYLGEVIRLVVKEYFVEHLKLNEAMLPPNLQKPYGLNTSWLGHNVALTEDITTLSAILNTSSELGSNAESTFLWTPALTTVLLRAERAVLERSTALVAAAIYALLVTIGEVHLTDEATGSTTAPIPIPTDAPSTTGKSSPLSPQSNASAPWSPTQGQGKELVVAYCGGLICLYHGYLERLHTDLLDLREMVRERDTVVALREASEGGVIGAGVLAGVAWNST